MCPFNAEHARGEAYIGRAPSGALFAGCQHNSCDWDWRQLRARFEPTPTNKRGRTAGILAPDPATAPALALLLPSPSPHHVRAST